MNHLSPFQFVQNEDGSMRLADMPGLTLKTVEGQGSAVGRDWAKELGMPVYYEEFGSRWRGSRATNAEAV